MSSLYNKFVSSYCNFSRSQFFRKIYDASWAGIDRSDEVSAIRDFLLSPEVGVDFLNSYIPRYFAQTDFVLKFASVFCHKKPIVKRTDKEKQKNPGSTDGCELGDLLVLFLLMDKNDNIHYSSGAIFQAKLTAKLDSATQRHLYDDDEEFILPGYIKSGRKLSENIRKMPTYADGRGSAFRYLILNPDWPFKDVQARHTPWANNYQLRWSTFLDGLLSGTDGLRVNLDTQTPNHWDKIVQDLLWVINNIKKNKPPRGNNAAAEIASGLFNDYTKVDDYFAEFEGESGAIPLMLIIAHAPHYEVEVDIE